MADKNSVIERAYRLRQLRRKTGLTRLAFAQQTGISANTLKALELGDRELTSQKALLFANLFSTLFSISLGKNGPEANFDFLYHGKVNNDPGEEDCDQVYNSSHVQDDIHFFKTNPAYITMELPDDLMSPFYNQGDVVGGRKVADKKEFPRYEGVVCLLETTKGGKLLRRIIKCKNQKITACLLNTAVNHGVNIVEDVDVNAIAQAIWHWHLSEMVSPE